MSWAGNYDQICHNAYRYSLNQLASKAQPYLAFIHFHLTHCSQIWRLRFGKDIIAIEQAQRHETTYNTASQDWWHYNCSLSCIRQNWVFFFCLKIKDESESLNISIYNPYLSCTISTSTFCCTSNKGSLL